MREYRSLLGQSSFYFGSTVLISLSRLISFPLWTRALTPAQYGIYSLINISVFFLTALSKNGLQKSAVRFFSEFAFRKRSESIAIYYTTHIVSVFISSILLNSIFVLVMWFFQGAFSEVDSLNIIVCLIFFLAMADALASILLAFLRVEQKAEQYTIWGVFNRYMGIIFSALLLFVFNLGLVGLVAGQLISASLVVMILIMKLIFTGKLKLKSASTKFFREAFNYGVPMMAAESSRLTLELGDRYLIQLFMGAAPVGLYSVGYNIATYIRELMALPLNRAIIPIYLDIWQKKGMAETKKFLETVLDFYLAIAIPLIFVVLYFRVDIIRFLASDKYIAAAGIVPFIVIPLILCGANGIYSAGLIIYKKTKIIMYVSFISAILNLILNLCLIPTFGLRGAAFATTCSYLLLIITTTFYSFNYLPLAFNWILIVKYSVAASVMILFFQIFRSETIIGVILNVIMGFILYSISLIIIDQRVRKKILLVFGS